MPEMTRSPLRLSREAPTRDALRFLVAFVQADLGQLPIRDLAHLTRSVHRFMHREDPGFWKARETPNLTKLELLQSRTLPMVRTVASGGGLASTGNLVLAFWLVVKDGAITFRSLGSDLDKFLYQVGRVLHEAGAGTVKACPATTKRRGQPDVVCGRLFVKATTKSYCSTRCEKRMTTRRNRM